MTRLLPGQGDIWDALVDVGVIPARPRECPVCGTHVTTASTGRPRVYCSDACRQKNNRRRQRVSLRDADPVTKPPGVA